MELSPDSVPVVEDMPLTDVLDLTDRKTKDRAARASKARKTSNRRHLVDPATCDREYSPAEMEFMQAIQAYKQASGRMFPTWSEVLEVLKGLGYQKES
ncbi:hypothetical protein [Singulisphaera sp. PoT]|uniref:hypothetical protein n=1 Tax=Singulisphaera sp. PoT TaxID=3411797 RepID=UPI003BF46AFB